MTAAMPLRVVEGASKFIEEMDLYTAVMEHKKVNDMQLLEDSIDLPDPAAEINLASNEKVIKFCG